MWKDNKNPLDSFEPKLVSTGNVDRSNRELIRSVLPKGASLVPERNSRRTASGGFFGQSLPGGTSPMVSGGGGGSTMYHTMRPYDPTIESTDKQFYPQDRVQANRWWRLYYKHDALVGTAIDMYAEMIISSFGLIVPDDPSKEISDSLNYMCDTVDVIDKLKSLLKEYLIVGEAAPHCIFDDSLNLWSYIGFHDPDYLDIHDLPIVNMPPIVKFVPDHNLRTTLSDGSPESREFRSRLPGEFVSKVLAGQPIRLNPVNCTFIPRKNHPYDLRGCSLLSRLFRILMVEDAVFASTIATYRRNAAPLKVCKLGQADQMWIPSPEQEAKVMNMLTQAETDPQSWLLYSYGINFEAFGTADRAITFSKEQQAIDNLKLTGLGLSKGFISGEANYASSKASLQVLLRRLLSLRQFIENVWLYPKFFRPICEINEWTKSVPSEITHRYRVKRTAQEIQEKNLVIIPKIQWSNRLDPSIDTEVIQAFNLLKSSFNFKISKDTLGSFASLDWYEEEKKSASEFKASKELSERLLGETLDKEYQQQGAAKAPEGAKPPGAAGSGAKPPSAGGGKGSGETGATSSPPGSKGENPSFGAAPSDGALNAPPIPASSGGGLSLP